MRLSLRNTAAISNVFFSDNHFSCIVAFIGVRAASVSFEMLAFGRLFMLTKSAIRAQESISIGHVIRIAALRLEDR